MTLKVIGTGFGRTGTDSMREALTMLGFGPCHHMFEVIAHDEQKARWRALLGGEAPVWSDLFEGYAACVDWPSAAYWRELIEAYPEAKAILTWRTPESWWNSFSTTILPRVLPEGEGPTVGRMVVMKVFDGRPDDRDHAIATYRAHVEAVLTEVPPARLLVHRLGDGWGPLCAHLGVPVPDAPYPRSNSKEAFQARFAQT
ncbi:MAG: sulfotransferase family protein [Paracoccaceae bacterium]|nr:sulfotransferase family protein [Paracoccaceae bacterium]MDE3120716.1 sulfotransferase family protein [Paracoccaceae bacterium]